MQKFSPRSKSTNVSLPQTALCSSSRETTLPAWSMRQESTCAGCDCKRSSAPSRRSSRVATSNSKRPNRKRPELISQRLLGGSDFFRDGFGLEEQEEVILAAGL